MKFSRLVGHVIQQVVLNFGHDAARGAPVARAHVRHRVSIRIATGAEQRARALGSVVRLKN